MCLSAVDEEPSIYSDNRYASLELQDRQHFSSYQSGRWDVLHSVWDCLLKELDFDHIESRDRFSL